MQAPSSPLPDPSCRHRRAAATVTVRRADGTVCADADVVVEQVRHAFPFGNIGFDFVALANGEDDGTGAVPAFGGAAPGSAAGLVEPWLDLFNAATIPFYWAGFEPSPGQPDTDRLLATARWGSASAACR